MLVYISAPYSNGDQIANIHDAILAADSLVAMGYVPYIPHLTAFWHFVSPKSYNIWMKIDLEILSRCDAVLRIGGESVGANKEVREAESLGIPVYYSIEELEKMEQK